jgi:hypothetical protein
MNSPKTAIPWLLLGFHAAAFGRGVTPYLPLNLEPEMESQIERVLILADKPVMKRPIPAAAVLDALPKACQFDSALCERVRRFLARYTHTTDIAYASVGAAASTGKGAPTTVIPNRYGMEEDSHWNAAGQVYWQPSDYLLVGLGANAYQGKTDFTGSLVSFGFDFAQLDIGFRPHWFSPLSDSSMLMSTEAPTMPSVTLSNYRPLTRLGLHYELFAARMSESEHIQFRDGFTVGHPRLVGFHIDMEPASGWSLGLNRLLQYGGGARNTNSLKDVFDAFFNPSKFDNTSSSLTSDQQAGNQEASWTSSFLFPGKVPFVVYFEYAGEDTSRGRNYLLGNAALSAGIHFPRLWRHFDLTLETTEWQDAWYIHSVYQDGLTNYGRVIGHWFGDQRVPQDYIGGRSEMVKLGWEPPFGGLFELRYRTLQNEHYLSTDYPYQRYHDVSLAYSRPWQGVLVGGQVESGHDVFGGKFTRLEGFVRYDKLTSGLATLMSDEFTARESETPLLKSAELFVDAGANASRQSVDLYSAADRTTSRIGYGYHFALGARRAVSDHSDLGARVEADNVQGHSLIGVRALDYRYRFNNPLAASFFIGAARYALASPAYSYYYGVGLSWRNLFPGWDLGVDVRYADTVARDHLFASELAQQKGSQNDSFYNILSTTLSISRHF